MTRRAREPFPVGGVTAYWNGTCPKCDRDVRGRQVTRRGHDWVCIDCHHRDHE